MRVFISWSGERSKGLAFAFRDWLPLVLHYAEPWLSEADIEAGERWAQSVAKELEASNFGIVCVTPENLGSPWLLFEAGALTKSLETSRVIPLLLELEFSDISGPLAQFQAKKLNRAGVGEIIHSLQQCAESPIPDERAKQLFEALWPEFEKRLKVLPARPPSQRHARPQHEVLEELVSSIRALDSRVRESEQKIAELPRTRRSRAERLHPVMLVEMSHFLGEEPEDPIGILVMASVFRDEVPWLFEAGLEAYRAALGHRRDHRRLLERFHRLVNMTLRGPFPSETLGVDPRMLETVGRELERYLARQYALADPSEERSTKETRG